MTVPARGVVRFAAVGDLLLAPALKGAPYPRSAALISPAVRELLAECDLVFGNLECAVPGDGRCVPTEPRVVATPDLVRAVKAAGFGVVALANNHAFDCLEGGFRNLRNLLQQIGLPHFGAGMSLDEAAAPAILEAHGLRVAFLGAVDERSGACQFAAPGQCGVAPLDMPRLTAQIREVRSKVDHVIVSIHWGEERFLVPSPVQIDQAHALVDAGASMVLGHHPHVLQGMEVRHGAVIAYSLGNFIADEVPFTDGGKNQWNRTGRTGGILMAELSDRGLQRVHQVPTYDPGTAVELDRGSFGRRRIEKTNRAIARGVTLARYRWEHLWVKTIRPIVYHLRWSELKMLRFRHVRKAVQGLLHARTAR